MVTFSKVNSGTYSLQKDPAKRPKAAELLTHPFITRYNEADADMIFWLKDYLDYFETVTKKNLEQ